MVKRQPARLDAAARRQQILDSALPVFARLGCAGTGTRQLAAAAGVTEPVLYRHFRSKEGLFVAVLDQTGERLCAAVTAVMSASGSARDRLLALAQGLPKLLERHADELRVLCGAAAGRGDAATERAVRRAFAAIGAVLGEAWSGGGLRAGVTPSTAAFFLLEIGLGAALLRPSGVAAVDRPAFGKQVADLMVAALLDPRARRRRA